MLRISILRSVQKDWPQLNNRVTTAARRLTLSSVNTTLHSHWHVVDSVSWGQTVCVLQQQQQQQQWSTNKPDAISLGAAVISTTFPPLHRLASACPSAQHNRRKQQDWPVTTTVRLLLSMSRPLTEEALVLLLSLLQDRGPWRSLLTPHSWLFLLLCPHTDTAGALHAASRPALRATSWRQRRTHIFQK